jgi:hypothetical protein
VLVALGPLGLLGLLGLLACNSEPDATCDPPMIDELALRSLATRTITELAAAPRATETEREAARAWIESRVHELGLQPARQPYATGANVVATVPATAAEHPELVDEIIVGAHFDTVAGSPGANDNASGVAVALAVASVVPQVRCRRAAVTIVLFDEEEVGITGSAAFAATRAPAQVRAVHSIDQVGWDADLDRRFELELPTHALELEYRDAASALGTDVVVTAVDASDHRAFRELGFAVVGITEEYTSGDTTPHRHQPTDVAATVDIEYVMLAARLVTRVVASELAL